MSTYPFFGIKKISMIFMNQTYDFWLCDNIERNWTHTNPFNAKNQFIFSRFSKGHLFQASFPSCFRQIPHGRAFFPSSFSKNPHGRTFFTCLFFPNPHGRTFSIFCFFRNSHGRACSTFFFFKNPHGREYFVVRKPCMMQNLRLAEKRSEKFSTHR